MGIAKRSHSPDSHQEPEGSELEEALPPHVRGQLDIRSFCEMKSSCGSNLVSMRSPGDVDKAEPSRDTTHALIKLPGQKDIRSFCRPSLWVKYYRDRSFAHEEEAALDLGLSLGFESEEETEEVKCAQVALQDEEMDEIVELPSYFTEEEEAAKAMGLDLTFDGEAVETQAIPIFDTDLEEAWNEAQEDQYLADEKAAHHLGLSLGFESEEEAEEIKCAYVALEEEMEEIVELPSDFTEEEDAAKAMGLAGLSLDFDGEGVEKQPIPILNTDLEEAWNAAHEDQYLADEESAVAMGLQLSIDDSDEMRHVDKKARLTLPAEPAIPIPVEAAIPSPATPPKRMLAAKLTEDSMGKATPSQDFKRRRVVDDSSTDTISGKSADTKMQPAVKQISTVEIQSV